ncbi:type II toxin-antitoxin system RelE/ParE family toxin [Paenibacillus eucommiae]|uniref:Plasmid stabilization system protein ParE n=1 Tax=Paenibacillus eucommiae TaxID=1355755 RepID=A0ABS4INH7_9BACL|nr:type II toxin-antitoxin system RelE/ParE family toxin [Paenibacillus eucommiae]MBP1988720.1 plasmid stabilization system protein ParE [Paenibacillus eucommiae]
MQIKWTKSAKESLGQIQSTHFSEQETRQYKKDLVCRIERQVLTLNEAIPVQEPSWKGTYRLLIDKYKVYYSFSEDKSSCFIEALWHQRQKHK